MTWSGKNQITQMKAGIETLTVELTMKSEKWVVCSLCKQPKVSNQKLVSVLEYMLGKLYHEYINVILVGDININMSKPPSTINDALEVYGFVNIVNVHTSHKSNNGTIIDVILTNVPKRLQHVTAVDTGPSDFHSMVCFSTKFHVPVQRTATIT